MSIVRLAVVAAVLTVACAGDGQAQQRPEACFWVHGRLSAYNGSPTFRIWPIGTRRLLGVDQGHGSDDGFDSLPPPVKRLVEPDAFQVDVLGDFQVCPLAPDRPGKMRPVKLTGGRNLSTRPAKPY
jgi:hypothetical protein